MNPNAPGKNYLLVVGILLVIGGGLSMFLVIPTLLLGIASLSMGGLGMILFLAALLACATAIIDLIAGILGIVNRNKPEKAKNLHGLWHHDDRLCCAGLHQLYWRAGRQLCLCHLRPGVAHPVSGWRSQEQECRCGADVENDYKKSAYRSALFFVPLYCRCRNCRNHDILMPSI